MFGNQNGFGANKSNKEKGNDGNLNNVFDRVQQQSGVNKDTIFKLADTLQTANFKDEKVVRDLVRKLAVLAGKPITKEKEDQIVKLVINNNLPIDFNSLTGMISGKK